VSNPQGWLSPLPLALTACVAGAALEGLAAGRGTREFLGSLRPPRGSPTFSVWVTIGALYYLVCGGVIFRLASSPAPSPAWRAAVVLLAAVMLSNAGWNFVFFRLRDLRGAFLYLIPYGLLAGTLELALGATDRIAAWIFAPYLLYLPYACRWTYRLSRLNRGRRSPL
jgi:tryptophan-rich sensory protein